MRLRGDGAALHAVTAADEQDPSTPAADPSVRWLVPPARFLRVPSPALNEGIRVPTPLWAVTRVTSRSWTRPLGSTFVGEDATAQGAEWHVGGGRGMRTQIPPVTTVRNCRALPPPPCSRPPSEHGRAPGARRSPQIHRGGMPAGWGPSGRPLGRARVLSICNEVQFPKFLTVFQSHLSSLSRLCTTSPD